MIRKRTEHQQPSQQWRNLKPGNDPGQLLNNIERNSPAFTPEGLMVELKWSLNE